MNRAKTAILASLAVAAVVTLFANDAEAFHRRRAGYGHGYYADPYSQPWAANRSYWGQGYWYNSPYYSRGHLYNSYDGYGYGYTGSLSRGGYRPSYSYGLYNTAGIYNTSFVGPGYDYYDGAVASYDYAPYSYVRPATVQPVAYGVSYGSYGYGSVGCSCNQ